MNETKGSRLLEKLKNDPEKYLRNKKFRLLLQEYFDSLSKDALREALRDSREAFV
jgi:hypothetical protein